MLLDSIVSFFFLNHELGIYNNKRVMHRYSGPNKYLHYKINIMKIFILMKESCIDIVDPINCSSPVRLKIETEKT